MLARLPETGLGIALPGNHRFGPEISGALQAMPGVVMVEEF
ncbi:MAG TPA: hypothetical protein VLA52_14050 [Thermohalobaculum sp.]|nr:hypothetical protein [Thermohalobaculum sp.]